MIRKENVLKSSEDIYVPAKINFGEFILNRLWQEREKDCLTNGATEECLTNAKTVQYAMNLAISLTRMGLRKGHTVAICSENRIEFFPTVIGVACTGAVMTAINVAYTADELKHVMDISKPEYIFCSTTVYKIHEELFWSLGFVRKIILFGTPGSEKVPRTFLYTELVIPSKELRLEDVKYEEFEVAEVDGQSDTLFVLYTSGTTGLPKAVVLTHLNVIAACCLPTLHHPDALFLVTFPWFYSMGLLNTLTAMAHNRTTIFLSKFETEQYMRTIEKYKIEHLESIPSMLMDVANSTSSFDMSSVKTVSSGAATLHPQTMQALKEKLPNASTAVQAYGMTETTTAIIKYDCNTVHEAKSGGLGFLVAGSTAKVVDLETRKPVGPNQDGELLLKGPLVMKTYIGRDSSSDFDKHGFLKTGDVVYYEADGTFYFVDRVVELIKFKEHLVPPSEMEAVLLEHEAVKDVGVVGVEDPTSGEVPIAFVVKNPNVDVSQEDLKQFVASRLSEPKHLGGVHFVDKIPRNQSGKILRKQLRTVVRGDKSFYGSVLKIMKLNRKN